MKVTHYATALVATTVGFYASNCYAADVTWNGFASIVAGQTLDSGDTYIVDQDIVNPGTYDDELSFRPESLLGLQARATVSDQISVTAQLLAKAQEDFDVGLEWAYLTYQLADSTYMNIGRIRIPFYYYSDFFDAGYAYYWTRPPVEVYSVPATSFNGATLVNSYYLGSLGVTSQVWYGGDNIWDGNGAESELRDDIGVAVTLEYDWAKLRLMYNQKEQVPVSAPSVGLELISQNINYMAAAFIVDYNNFYWRSEYTRLASDYDLVFHTGTADIPIESTVEYDAWYASVGYRFGDFTPYYTRSFVELTPADQLGSPAGDVNTNTIGLRWDVQPGTALKLEYSDRVVDPINVTDPIPAAAPGHDESVISIALDVVF